MRVWTSRLGSTPDYSPKLIECSDRSRLLFFLISKKGAGLVVLVAPSF